MGGPTAHEGGPDHLHLAVHDGKLWVQTGTDVAVWRFATTPSSCFAPVTCHLAGDLPFITVAFWCRSGCRWIPSLNVSSVAVQRSVLVTAGFKLPIMQRSLIHEVSHVSSPRRHIHPSPWPPATLTWNNGYCGLMLISPHHTWQSNRGVEICGCHSTWVCFHFYCRSQWPGLDV